MGQPAWEHVQGGNAYERYIGAQITAAAWDAAEEECLNDVDAYADWIAGHCMFEAPIVIRAALICADTFDVSAYTVPYLVRVTLSNGISAHLRQLAQAELTERYLKASDARIARRAAEIGRDE